MRVRVVEDNISLCQSNRFRQPHAGIAYKSGNPSDIVIKLHAF